MDVENVKKDINLSRTAGQLDTSTSSAPQTPDKKDKTALESSVELDSTKVPSNNVGCSGECSNMEPSSQHNEHQAKNNNGKQNLMSGPNNQSANSIVSTNKEIISREADKEEHEDRASVSELDSKNQVEKRQGSLSVKKVGVEGNEGRRPSVKDSGVQCCEDQINERSDTQSYTLKAPENFLPNGLALIIAVIAIAVAFYTQFISIPYLKINPEHFPEVQESIKVLSEHLSGVKSSLQDIEQIQVRIKGFEDSLKNLKAIAYKDSNSNLVKKKELEDRITKSEHDLLDQISLKIEEINVLKDDFLKFKNEVGVKVDGINNIQKEQKELKENMMTVGDKLGQQSQFVEKKTAQMEKQISRHNETLHGLNVSVENLGSNLKHVTENMTGISIETLVLEKRTEDIKENIFDKGSLIVVIMINTSLLVVVIIYLVASRDTNRQVNRNVDIGHQQSNDGVNQNPAAYSTAGRILSQVRTHLQLERKICSISFYEETHPLHMCMTQSVTRQLNLQPVEFIIRRHEDILKIPPVSLYFLFVDFNERNVILEDPALGLGDLRLTTVQAVQKMGGRIVIFYVRDQNSRQLDSTTLYNEDLASVRRQHELSALNRLSRFISAYDQLTDFQKVHLKAIVTDEVIGH